VSPSEESLLLAESIRAICAEEGIELLLIGAVALAAHGYPRQTEDIDFAVALPPAELPALARALERSGAQADLVLPDARDPLGGVITLTREGLAPIQIVNFDNSPSGGFPRLVRDALVRATFSDGIVGKFPAVEDLVLFKLYAGGPKSQLDILELLTRAKVDLRVLRERAAGYRMSEPLNAVLQLAGVADESP
jgi:hypothetical protein